MQYIFFFEERPVSCYLFSDNGVVLIALFRCLSLDSSSHLVFSSVWRLQASFTGEDNPLEFTLDTLYSSASVEEEVARNMLFISAR